MKKLIMYFAIVGFAFNAHSQNVIQGEYFIDSDPGFGHATAFLLTIPGTDITQAIDIPYNAFPSPGYHSVFIRTKDVNGNWSFTGKRYVEAAANMNPLNVVRVEYFFNTDNGFGNNSYVLLNSPNDNTWNFDIPFNQLPLAQTPNDTLFLRVQDSSNGNWSLTTSIDSLNYVMVGIKELAEVTGVSVFPNPFSDIITVTQKDSGKARFALYDGSGRVMLDKIVGQTNQINTKLFPPGTYIVLVFTEKHNIYRSTLVKH